MKQGETKIRKAGADDIPAVVELERGIPLAPHWPKRKYAEIGAVEPAQAAVRRCLFVAVREDRVLGFAVGGATVAGGETEAELESVVVAPEARRRGLARALCRAVLDWSGEQGASTVRLEVRAGSAGAIALYRGLGFNEVALRPAYYSSPLEDALGMQAPSAGCGER